MKDTNKYSPEMTDREILAMLAEIFGVGVNQDSYRSDSTGEGA